MVVVVVKVGRALGTLFRLFGAMRWSMLCSNVGVGRCDIFVSFNAPQSQHRALFSDDLYLLDPLSLKLVSLISPLHPSAFIRCHQSPYAFQ